MIWVVNPDRGSRYRRDNSMNGFLLPGSREPDNRDVYKRQVVISESVLKTQSLDSLKLVLESHQDSVVHRDLLVSSELELSLINIYHSGIWIR